METLATSCDGAGDIGGWPGRQPKSQQWAGSCGWSGGGQPWDHHPTGLLVLEGLPPWYWVMEYGAQSKTETSKLGLR